MTAHGERTYPHECCGFLIGRRQEGRKRVEEVRPAGNARGRLAAEPLPDLAGGDAPRRAGRAPRRARDPRASTTRTRTCPPGRRSTTWTTPGRSTPSSSCPCTRGGPRRCTLGARRRPLTALRKRPMTVDRGMRKHNGLSKVLIPTALGQYSGGTRRWRWRAARWARCWTTWPSSIPELQRHLLTEQTASCAAS